MALDRLADNVGRTARWSLMRSLRFFGVELRPSTKLVEITDDGVVVESNIGREFIPADTVIMAVGVHSVNELTKEIEDDGIIAHYDRGCQRAAQDHRGCARRI